MESHIHNEKNKINQDIDTKIGENTSLLNQSRSNLYQNFDSFLDMEISKILKI